MTRNQVETAPSSTEHGKLAPSPSGSPAALERGADGSLAPRHALLRTVLPSVDPGSAPPVELSLVAPVFEERDNLRPLYAKVIDVFGAGRDWELVLVDDGSRDGSSDVIRELAREDQRVVAVFFSENRGQSAALAAGVHAARGRRVATLDADLQNDPADLPAMIEALGDHDAVVGFRLRRQDTFVRRISSRIGNGVRNWISLDRVRDTGCSLKVFRAEAMRSIPWFHGAHRFLPTLLRYQGFRVIERPVSHHPRRAGKSKYGIGNRALRGLLDLLAVRWMRSRLIDFPVREVIRVP
ncbi:MAG TPA: glycosyltransferase family 2 protein [Planctomycetota bacterium]|jgi:glycosyltransferase involved in cell wall biosynthesis|nr:glycosyltransferase family 2 protein [Planctomycetota bacterium]